MAKWGAKNQDAAFMQLQKQNSATQALYFTGTNSG